MSLSIIIPCHNEEKVISNTLENIGSYLNNVNYEIVLINDFSSDQTYNKFIELSQLHKNIIYKNNIHPGLGGAIVAGINASNFEYICIFMADMSDSVEDLKKYYSLIQLKKLDAVFGSRFIKGSRIINYPKSKLILNRIFNYIVKVLFLSNYNDFTNAFKIYKKDTLLKLFPIVSENFNVFLELPLKIISRRYSYEIVSISWTNRKKGLSKFNIKELTSKYIFTLIYCFLEKILLKKTNSN
jgi:dolichol-phosphate mannosyltransferase